jgi:hypothetical protein
MLYAQLVNNGQVPDAQITLEHGLNEGFFGDEEAEDLQEYSASELMRLLEKRQDEFSAEAEAHEIRRNIRYYGHA